MGKANSEAALSAIGSNETLSTGATLLLLYLGHLISDTGGELTAGCEYLGNALSKPASTVRRWRNELVTAGYLEPIFLGDGGRRSNTYRLTLTPPRAEGTPPRAEGSTPPWAEGTPPSPLHGRRGTGTEIEPKEASAVAEAAAYIAKNRPGVKIWRAYARKLTEDETPDRILQMAAEIREKATAQDRNAQLARAIEACEQCDSNGFTQRLDDDEIARMYRCDHQGPA